MSQTAQPLTATELSQLIDDRLPLTDLLQLIDRTYYDEHNVRRIQTLLKGVARWTLNNQMNDRPIASIPSYTIINRFNKEVTIRPISETGRLQLSAKLHELITMCTTLLTDTRTYSPDDVDPILVHKPNETPSTTLLRNSAFDYRISESFSSFLHDTVTCLVSLASSLTTDDKAILVLTHAISDIITMTDKPSTTPHLPPISSPLMEDTTGEQFISRTMLDRMRHITNNIITLTRSHLEGDDNSITSLYKSINELATQLNDIFDQFGPSSLTDNDLVTTAHKMTIRGGGVLTKSMLKNVALSLARRIWLVCSQKTILKHFDGATINDVPSKAYPFLRVDEPTLEVFYNLILHVLTTSLPHSAVDWLVDAMICIAGNTNHVTFDPYPVANIRDNQLQGKILVENVRHCRDWL